MNDRNRAWRRRMSLKAKARQRRAQKHRKRGCHNWCPWCEKNRQKKEPGRSSRLGL